MSLWSTCLETNDRFSHKSAQYSKPVIVSNDIQVTLKVIIKHQTFEMNFRVSKTLDTDLHV